MKACTSCWATLIALALPLSCGGAEPSTSTRDVRVDPSSALMTRDLPPACCDFDTECPGAHGQCVPATSGECAVLGQGLCL
jgi:hypothetical protein